MHIFIEKFKGIKINAGEINNQSLKEIKFYENIVIEDLDRQVDENLFFTLLKKKNLKENWLVL